MLTTTLEIVPGETGVWLATITDADGVAQSLAQLASAEFVVKASKAATATALFTLTLAGGALAVVDAAAGTLRITASAASTALLSPGRKYRYYLKLTFSDTTVSYPDGLAGEFLALAV